MIELLYLKDSYQLVCDAKVTAIIEDGDGFSVVFDKTPFFVGGGGQPSDKGTANELYITEAYEAGGLIYHKLSSKGCTFSVGDTVTLGVFYKIRFERMRAHTGEHIVSGIAHNLFGVDNVGFHMDENALMTVDFNKYLNKEELQLLEFEANRCVMRNLKVSSEIFTVEKASEFDYRSKLEFQDDVRIVTIGDIDKCACCAPHLKSTGEVGLIKILSSASHRGGIRITLICGEKAYSEAEKRYRQIMNISALLCSKYDEADNAVSELIDTNKSLNYEIEQTKTKYLQHISAKISEAEVIIEFFDCFSLDELRIINNNLKSKCTIALLFSGNDSDGYNYSIMSEKLKLENIVREFNNSLHGKGGGRGVLVQGKVSAASSDIIKFINDMKVENYENA